MPTSATPGPQGDDGSPEGDRGGPQAARRGRVGGAAARGEEASTRRRKREERGSRSQASRFAEVAQGGLDAAPLRLHTGEEQPGSPVGGLSSGRALQVRGGRSERSRGLGEQRALDIGRRRP